MQLTEHFSFEEFTTTEMRGMVDTNTAQAQNYLPALRVTAQLLEQVRAVLGGQPLVVDSGFRCPELNQLVGGSPFSQHVIGEAVDFRAPEWTDEQKMDALVSIQNSGIRFHQLLIENGCLHIAQPHPNDVQGEVAYWNAGVKQILRAGVSA